MHNSIFKVFQVSCKPIHIFIRENIGSVTIHNLSVEFEPEATNKECYRRHAFSVCRVIFKMSYDSFNAINACDLTNVFAVLFTLVDICADSFSGTGIGHHSVKACSKSRFDYSWIRSIIECCVLKIIYESRQRCTVIYPCYMGESVLRIIIFPITLVASMLYTQLYLYHLRYNILNNICIKFIFVSCLFCGLDSCQELPDWHAFPIKLEYFFLWMARRPANFLFRDKTLFSLAAVRRFRNWYLE